MLSNSWKFSGHGEQCLFFNSWKSSKRCIDRNMHCQYSLYISVFVASDIYMLQTTE